jgi:S1-C subfamily serine protease
MTSPDPRHGAIAGFRVDVHAGWPSRFLFWKSFDLFWTGQAFAVDDRRLLTCLHVVGRCTPENLRFPNHPDLPPIARILRPDENTTYGADVAVIEFSAPHGLPVAPLATARPSVGSTLLMDNKHGKLETGIVHSYGVTADIWQALISAGVIDGASLPQSLTERMAASRKHEIGDMRSNLKVRKGDSGSPVFAPDGTVVGMAHGSSTLTYQSLMMPADLLRQYYEALIAR